jgi:hypothetical protein
VPDIQVHSETNELVCVVEIGYTRPEKIKRYRQLGIGDVRWYSKDGELINAEERTVVVERRVRHILRDDDPYKGCPICEEMACPHCRLRHENEGKLLEECYLVQGEMWINGTRGFAVFECEECGKPTFLTGEELREALFELGIEGFDDYLAHRAEYVRAPGRRQLEDHPDYPEFYAPILKQTTMSFSELQAYIKTEWGGHKISLNYEELPKLGWQVD